MHRWRVSVSIACWWCAVASLHPNSLSTLKAGSVDIDPGDSFPECWSQGYSEQLCCRCGWTQCWLPPLFTVERCCSLHSGRGAVLSAVKPKEGFPPEAASLAHRNLTEANTKEAQERLCGRGGLQEAARCSREDAALHDPRCRVLLGYVTSLSFTCERHLRSACSKGLTIAVYAAELLAPKLWGAPRLGSPSYHARSCFWSLGRLRQANDFIQQNATDGPPEQPGSKRWFESIYKLIMLRCLNVRGRELQAQVPKASALWLSHHSVKQSTRDTAIRPHPNYQHHSGPDVRKQVIGIVIAMNMKSYKFYGQILELWECYCRYHGDCKVVVDTTDLPDSQYPEKPEMDEASGQIKVKAAKEWNRWLALRRHIGSFDFVFSIDPDQYPSQLCFLRTSLSNAFHVLGLTRWGFGAAALSTLDHQADASDGKQMESPSHVWMGPDIVARDGPVYHDFNSASVFLRNSAGGRLFLDLVLGKMHWRGLVRLDQSAFDQTVLEALDLWRLARGQSAMGITCLQYLFPDTSASYSGEPYANCWHSVVEKVLGLFDQPGGRGQKADSLQAPVHLADPRVVDINFVPGNRSLIQQPLIWHLAGKDKHRMINSHQSLLDFQVQTQWNNASLPRRERPGLWSWAWALASNDTQARGARPRAHLSGTANPRCEAVVRAAAISNVGDGNGVCGGTIVQDCRESHQYNC